MYYLIILATAFVVQSFYSQEVISIAINSYHNTGLDYFFRYITYLGDGYVVSVIGVLLMFYNRKAGLVVLTAYASSALITQGLKHFVFEDMRRPVMMFKDYNISLHYVVGVDIHEYNSFPSGHSTSIFALATALCFLVKRKTLIPVFLTIAVIVAFSRIYLLEHFLKDTLAGSLIGFITSITVYYLYFRNETKSG